MNEALLISCVSRVTGTLSILGSSSIIYMILSDRERKLVHPYQRLMLLMSIFDVLQSIAVVVSVTAFPKESQIYGALGNARTCAAQGFFMVLGLAVPLYNMNLNIFYVLAIQYRCSSQRYAKFEPAAHAVSILLPLSIAVIAIPYYAATRTGPVCVPRGGTLNRFLAMITMIVCFFVCIVSMVCICWTVISQATRMGKYTNHGSPNVASRRSRLDEDKHKTIKQACAYASAFILTYTFPLIGFAIVRGRSGVPAPFAIILLSSIFYPLQGFWNFLFYARPGVEYIMEANPDNSFVRALHDLIFNPQSLAAIRQRQSLRRRTSAVSMLGRLCQTNHPSSGEILNTRGLDQSPDESNESETQIRGLSATICSDKSTSCGAIKDLEHQTNTHSKPPSQMRRLSLVQVGSILNHTDLIDMNNECDSDGS